MKRFIAALSILALFTFTAKSEIKLQTVQKYPVRYPSEYFCTNGIFCYYQSGNKVYNYVNFEMLKANGTIHSLEILPTGTSFYALCSSDNQIYRLKTNGRTGSKLLSALNMANPSCFCFSGDASKIFVSGADGFIHVVSLLDKTTVKTIAEPSFCNLVAVSPNMYYVVTAAGNHLNVYNYETGRLRLSISLSGGAEKIIFTQDSKQMYVLCRDASIHRYDAVDFKENMVVNGLGKALSFDVSNDGKYLAVATSGNEITIVNTYNPLQRQRMDIGENGLSDVYFETLRSGSERLIYNTSGAIVLSELTGREMNYTKLLREELGNRMDAWMKQMPGESREEYNLRVNDSTITAQSMLLHQEIATDLAKDYFEMPLFELQGYDFSNQILPISLGTMQQIYLTVPEDELNSFTDSLQLEFKEPVFMINSQDAFELVYVEVFNKATGKQYIFDNRERKSLDFLSVNDQYVPLELVKLSNMQEFELQKIKEDVIGESISKSIISSHTKVNVKTAVTQDYDAEGKRIFNFTVGMDYSVDEGFAEKEDYPSGTYGVDKSGSAKALCAIISKAFAGEFSKYIQSGKKVTIALTGCADAASIRNALKYGGEYGDFEDYPAFENGVVCGITVNAARGIRTNDELAFLRAAGLKNEICRSIKDLETMDCNFIYNIHVSDAVGAEHRRVSVSFTFPDSL